MCSAWGAAGGGEVPACLGTPASNTPGTQARPLTHLPGHATAPQPVTDYDPGVRNLVVIRYGVARRGAEKGYDDSP